MITRTFEEIVTPQWLRDEADRIEATPKAHQWGSCPITSDDEP